LRPNDAERRQPLAEVSRIRGRAGRRRYLATSDDDPDPIRSDTSRRETVAALGGDSSAGGPIPPRAALPALPRRRAGQAEPEVPSTGEPGPASTRPKPRLRQPERNEPVRRPGYCVTHRMLPTCGKHTTPFDDLPGAAALDGATGTRSSSDANEVWPQLLRRVPGLPRILHPPAIPTGGSSSCLESRALRRSLR